jgi:uncharacterized DUF497 family protein
MKFEWDEDKNKNNYAKQGVWFEEAQTIWADASSVEFYDPEHSKTEDRFMRIGHSTSLRLLLVVFCERENDIVRIISARKSTTKETKQYEEGI